MNIDMQVLDVKKNLGYKAAEFVENGMVVGLGTGSTAKFFIEALGKRCKEGLKIQAVSSSKRSEEQAAAEGIPLTSFDKISTIDLTVDGADEVDPNLYMIKGGGGALFREKILAYNSKDMLVIVDESKMVENLGTFPLPVEVTLFAYELTLKRIEKMGFKGSLRGESTPYLTDNGNYIFDILNAFPINNPKELHLELISIPGVVESGLFCELAKRILVGKNDGTIELIP